MRYDRQIQLFGRGTQSRIFASELRIQEVSPAIMEILKNAALTGFSFDFGGKGDFTVEQDEKVLKEMHFESVSSFFFGFAGFFYES